jgi:prevent-host-death family protein
MRITRDIQSLSDFKQNASKMVKQIRETGEPMVLTVNGKPAVVVQDVNAYQHQLDERERAEAEILRSRLKNIDDSDSWSTADEVFRRIGAKYGIEIPSE